jgi:hypothetical protein
MEIRLNLEIPGSFILPDGSTAPVRGVAAKVIDGQLVRVVYTVEKQNGAWIEMAGDAAPAQLDDGVA